MTANKEMIIRQRRATQDFLLEVTLKWLSSGEMQEITFLGIAQRANVSERTVYRYFENQEVLQATLVPLISKRLKDIEPPKDSTSFSQYAKELYSACEANSGLVRTLVTTSFGRNILNSEKTRRLKKIYAVLSKEFSSLDQLTVKCAAANIRLVCSGSSWEFYRFQAGLSLSASIASACEIIASVMDGLNSLKKRSEKT